MIIVVMLIAISLIIALIFLGIFFWNIKSGQYDDLVTPSVRILFGDEQSPADSKTTEGESNTGSAKRKELGSITS